MWKSTDGGDTWTELTRNRGLPQGTVGIIGVTVSPVDSQRVWALVEAQDGGLFRSADGGETWRRLTEGLPKGVIILTVLIFVSPSIAYKPLPPITPMLIVSVV